MKLYRTSVKEDLNVAVVFQHLAENYVTKVPCLGDSVRSLCLRCAAVCPSTLASTA